MRVRTTSRFGLFVIEKTYVKVIMSGALPILVAQGQEDTHLTSNPEISFFRTNFKRHVNFSQATLSQVITGNPQPGSVSTVTFTKKGDLLNYLYLTKKVNGVLQADITAGDIEKVEFMIGGQVIDQLTTDQMVSLRNFSARYPQTFRGTEEGGNLGFYGMYHFPLNFFFCENWQCSIPLIALQEERHAYLSAPGIQVAHRSQFQQPSVIYLFKIGYY